MREPPVIGVGMFSFDFGGSERVAADLALEFKARGYRVVCFAFHGASGPLRDELERASVRCLDMDYAGVKLQPRPLVYWWRLWRMLRKERVRALHVHHVGALMLIGVPAWLAGVPRVVMTEHGLQTLMERERHRRLTRRYARFVSEITVVEPNQIEYLVNTVRLSPARLHCVPNGIRLRLRAPADIARARQILGVERDTFAFLCVARLNPVKDIETLLRAFAAFPESMRERSRLFVVGDGEERAKLEALRASLGLERRVMFLGARSDVPGLLPGADALVLSSITEGLPMALLEAMAAGVPCVATAVGGIPALLSDGAGIVVPPKSPETLARAMAEIAQQPEMRARLAEKAADVIRERYRLEPVVDRYLQLLGLARLATCQ
jgi:glycosyltransferase involved in cell wall biosynthesis